MQRLKKRIINSTGPTRSIGAAALIVSVAGIMSRILGLVRDRLLASQFGAGDVLDIYNVAFRIPDLLFELLILGALGAAFIPIFTRLITQDKLDRAWQCAYGVLVLLIGSIAILSVVGIIFAPTLVHIIAPGFPEEKLQMTVEFTRIMFLAPIFLSISALFGSILISFKRFLLYALAPIFYNVGIIFGIIFFVDLWGPIGLAWGVVFGAFLHMLMHFPVITMRTKAFRFTSVRALANRDVLNVGRLMLPRMFASASNQLSLLVITFFASLLAAGSITVFTFAINIQSVVLGLVGVPFALAVFPVLSSYHAKGEDQHFTTLFSVTFRRILFYVVPLSFLMIVLREQIVRVIYGGGKFDWEATILTYQILGILAASLFAQSLIPLLTRSFYAMHNTKTPFYTAVSAQVFNISFVIIFIREWGIYAIAIGFSLAVVINMVLLLIFLRKRIQKLGGKSIARTFIRVFTAGLIAAAAAHGMTYAVDLVIGPIDTFIKIFSQLIIAGSIGIGAYLIVSSLFKFEEFYTLRDKLLPRLFGRPTVAIEEQKMK